MKKIKLTSDLSRDITFEGELIERVRRETGTGHHTLMEIYKTSGGNFACYKVYQTQWQGATDKHLARICKTHLEVIDFFGLGKQAKDLYYGVGINATISEEDFLKHGNPGQEDEDLNEFDRI